MNPTSIPLLPISIPSPSPSHLHPISIPSPSHPNNLDLSIPTSTPSEQYKIKIVRLDNGGEYTSTDFQNFFSEQGIQPEYTEPYSSHSNGTAERFIQTLIRMATCLLKHCNAPMRFWREAVYTASYLLNILPSKADGHPKGKTPYELWHGKTPDYHKLKIFGCSAYATVPTHLRKKFDDACVLGIMMGYSEAGRTAA